MSEINTKNTPFMLVLRVVVTVKPRKSELRFFCILANSKQIWDTPNSEYKTFSLSILIITSIVTYVLVRERKEASH